MKMFLMIATVFATLLAQAETKENLIYQCESVSASIKTSALKQGWVPAEETYFVSVGEARYSRPFGAPPSVPMSASYPVKVTKSNGEVVGYYDGSGRVEELKSDLTLIQEGDIAMGSLNLQHTVEGIKGQMNLYIPSATLNAELECSAGK